MSTDFSADLEPYSVAVVEIGADDRKVSILIRFEVSGSTFCKSREQTGALSQ